MPRSTFVFAVVFVSLSSLVFAQTGATIVGSVTDESKGVLPGATITATEVSTGRQQVAITDERGEYRLTVPAGTYRVQAELTGFSSILLPQIELLVGQNANIPFVLKVASLEETLTVTGESPLVDVRSTQVADNLDRRQMEELPISGRNWIELTILVKGITANDISGNKPGVGRDSEFQVNLDGQQISQAVAGSSSFGQPGIGREAIAEYQVVTNLFDVTQGRSAGIQVQAISRSGTNSVDGSFYGYFRDDRFNAADHVAKRVLPYKNRQIGGSIGGPIVRDRTHYFANYEYEHEPSTFVSTPTGYRSSLAIPVFRKHHRFLTRGDHQFGPGSNLSIRFTSYEDVNPFGRALGSGYPTLQSREGADTYSLQGTWTRVLSSSLVQEIKGGFFHYHWNHTPGEGVPLTPNYQFPGLNIGARTNYPEEFWQNTPSVRTDLSWHKGAHDIKFGGEFLAWRDTGWWQNFGRGAFTMSSLPADIERRFPLDAWNDPSRWDLTGLDPLVVRYRQFFAQEGFGQTGNCPNPDGCGNWSLDIPRKTYAAWIGDTWKISNHVTLNFGVRYDLDWGATSPPFVEETTVLIDNGKERFDAGYKNGVRDLNNVSPRFGFTYNVGGANDLVIRGGSGIYYGTSTSELAFGHQLFNGQRVLAAEVPNDRQPGFILNPFRGVTREDIVEGRVPLPPQALTIIADDYEAAGLWQSMVGMQKQFGAAIGIDADLLFYRGFDQSQHYDPNLFFDPVTGYNRHPNQFGRPIPTLANLQYRHSRGKSEGLSLATGVTRRFQNNWQAGVTYTHMFFRRDTGSGAGGFNGASDNNFCLECEFGRASDFQRHTLRGNGIVRLPWAVSLAGSYIYGSGNYFNASYAQNPFGQGATRLIPVPGATFGSLVGYDGSVLPRNSFQGEPIHKVDLRVSKEVALGGGMKLAGIAELFNVFNRANFGSYSTTLNTLNFGFPVQNLATTYAPRSGQLAFKLSF
jgi:hypothetical protein